jgi:hypothetical protein
MSESVECYLKRKAYPLIAHSLVRPIRQFASAICLSMLIGATGAIASDGAERGTAMVATATAPELKSSQASADAGKLPAATAATRATAKQIRAMPPRPLRARTASKSWHCFGPWCGRQFVLMLGVSY